MGLEKSGSPERLRIVQVNSTFDGLGTDNLTLELARGLHDAGHSVTIAASEGNWLIPKAKRFGLSVETFPPKTPLKLGMIRHLARLLRQQRAQFIHAHQGRDYWPAVIAARLAQVGTSVVVTRHLMTRPRFFTRWFLLRASDVVAVSKAMFDLLSRELSGPKSRLHQIYGGIDPIAFSPPTPEQMAQCRAKHRWPPDAVVFGIIGSFNLPRGKGHLELLQASAELKSRLKNFRLAIIGHGSLETLLRQKITQLGLQETVQLLGFSQDVPELVKALDILVHPTTGTEALGLVLLEAMACAKPVIASDVGGISEAFVNGQHGLLIPPADVAALSDAMFKLGSSPQKRSEMGLAARAHVERNFARELYAQNTISLYRSILARHHSA